MSDCGWCVQRVPGSSPGRGEEKDGSYTPECYEEWSDELQLIAKSLFAMQMNWIPQKTFPLHFNPATKGPADIMSVILSLTHVDEDKAGDRSVMLIEFEKQTGSFKRRVVLGIKSNQSLFAKGL